MKENSHLGQSLCSFPCLMVTELSEESKGRQAVSIRNGTPEEPQGEGEAGVGGAEALVFVLLYYIPGFFHAFFSFRKLREVTLIGMCDIPKAILVCLVTSAWERTESRDYLQMRRCAQVGTFRYSVWFASFLFFRCVVEEKNFFSSLVSYCGLMLHFCCLLAE